MQMIKLIIRIVLMHCLCTMVTSQLRQKMLRKILTETKLPFIQKLRSMEICYGEFLNSNIQGVEKKNRT